LGAAAFDLSPNSRLLGVGTGDGKLLLLDARTGRQAAAPIQVAAGIVSQVSFSPDGHSFAVSSNDHTASLWDLRSRKRLGDAFGPFRGTVPAVSFEPNGRLLIDLLSNAVEWPTDVRTWERFACRAAGRDLTRAEWHDLMPNRGYHPVCPA
jgi:WD40 repeat protein